MIRYDKLVGLIYLNVFKRIQGGPKKTKLTAIILSNLNRFSKSVNRKILQKMQ